MILTGKQIKALAEMVGFTISHWEDTGFDDDVLETKIVLKQDGNITLGHWYDYPEEGCIDLNDF